MNFPFIETQLHFQLHSLELYTNGVLAYLGYVTTKLIFVYVLNIFEA